MTATTLEESDVLSFEGEVTEGLLENGQYQVWYFGNSKESGNSYIKEEIENEVIRSISGSIATQSGALEDLGYCHIAKTTVTASVEDGEDLGDNHIPTGMYVTDEDCRLCAYDRWDGISIPPVIGRNPAGN